MEKFINFFFFIKEEKIRETFNFLMEYRHNYDNSLINYKTPWKTIFRCRMNACDGNRRFVEASHNLTCVTRSVALSLISFIIMYCASYTENACKVYVASTAWMMGRK